MRNDSQKRGKTIRGLVPKSVSNNRWSYETCRVTRGEEFTVGTDTKPIETWYMEFWKRHLQDFWTRAGFNLVIQVENLDEVSATELSQYKKGKVLWHIRMSMNAKVGPRYKSNPLFLHPIYTGIDPEGMVHEFGHWLGLDDEYPRSKCSPLGGSDYVMCDAFTLDQDNQKGVYPWIITRRYTVGTALDLD